MRTCTDTASFECPAGVQKPRMEKRVEPNRGSFTKGKLKKLSRQAAIKTERERNARLRDGAPSTSDSIPLNFCLRAPQLAN